MASYGKDDMLGIDLIPAAVIGLSWKAQLAQQIFSETGDKALKSWSGEHNWNVKLIDKLIEISSRTYLPGADKVLALSANAGITKASAISFLKNVDKFRNIKATPSIVTTAGELAKKLAEGAGGLAEGLGDTGKAVPWIALILALGVGSYLLFAGKRGVNLIPQIPSLK